MKVLINTVGQETLYALKKKIIFYFPLRNYWLLVFLLYFFNVIKFYYTYLVDINININKIFNIK